MKNLFLSAGIIAASALALVSCSQELAPATPDQGKPVTYTLNVATPETETKTTVDDSWNVAWASGDKISAVVNSTAATFSYESGNSFTTTDELTLGSSNNWYLLYPSTNFFTSVSSEGYAANSSGANTYFDIPSKTNTQISVGSKSHLGGQPLYGVGTSTGSGAASVQMNHLVSVIRIQVTNSTSAAINVAKVKVENNADARMSGTYYLKFTDGTTEGSSNTKDGVTTEYSFPNAELSVSNGSIAKNGTGEFYVPVHPFSLDSGDKVTVTLTLSDNSTATFEKAVSDAVDFTAGHIKTRKITVKDSDIVAGGQFVEFTPDGSNTTAGEITKTINPVTLTLSNGVIRTEQIRIYRNATITFTSSTNTITKIEFTCSASNDDQYGPGNFKAQTGYSYSGKVGTWTGSSNSVSFNAEAAQVRATSIKVYYE